MKIKLTYFLIILNILAGALLYFQKIPNKSLSTPSVSIKNKTLSDFSKITFESNFLKKKYIIEKDSSNTWMVKNPDEWRANIFSLNYIFHELQTIKTSQFKASPPPINHYIKVSFTSNNKPSFLIFFYQKDSPSLFVYDSSLKASAQIFSPIDREIAKSLGEIFNKKAFSLIPSLINSITISSKGTQHRTILLKNASNDWFFEIPINAPVQQEEFIEQLRKLTELKFSDFSKYQGNKKSSIKIILQNDKQSESIEILGKIKGSSDSYYVSLDEKSVVTVKSPVLKAFFNLEENFRNKKLFYKINYHKISEISVRTKELAYKINTSLKGNPTIKDIKTKSTNNYSADSSKVNNLKKALCSQNIINYVTEIATETELKNYQLNAPQQEITIQTSDKTKQTLLIGHETKDGYYGKLKDKDRIYLIKKSFVEEIPKDYFYIRKRNTKLIPVDFDIQKIRLIDLKKDKEILSSNKKIQNLFHKGILLEMQIIDFLPVKKTEWDYKLIISGNKKQILYLIKKEKNSMVLFNPILPYYFKINESLINSLIAK